MDDTSPVKLVDETPNVPPMPVPPVPNAPPSPPPPSPTPVNQSLPTTVSPATPPQYYTSQNSMVSSKPESHTFRNIFLTTLGIGCLLLISGVVYFYWTFVRPRWYLATALSNLVVAESYHFRTDFPLINQSKFTIEGDNFYDPSTIRSTKISYTVNGDLGQTVTTSIDTIASKSYDYVKPTNTHMTQMYNQLLTIEPNLIDDPALAVIQPVLFGSSWAQYTNETIKSADADEPNYVSPLEFLLVLSIGTKINSYDSSMQIDNQTYDQYTLGLENGAIIALIEEIKDRNFSIDVADLNRIVDAINQLSPSNTGTLTIVINKQTHLPHLITLKLPDQLIEALLDGTDDEEELISPFISVSENPLQLVRWFPTGGSSPHLTFQFSQYNQVKVAEPPTSTILIEETENAPELLGYIIAYLTNPTMSLNATGKNNAFITSTHEAKLLFNQGKYTEGLNMASKALTLAETDEEKAFANYWMGLHTYKLGRSTEAEPLLLKAASLKEKYAGPYVTLGAISADRGNFEQMKTYSLKCVEYDPQYAWCYNNLGLSYAYLGNYQEAIPQLEKAVSLDPLNFVFNDNLKRVKANQ